VPFVVPALVLVALIAWIVFFATGHYIAAIFVGTFGALIWQGRRRFASRFARPS
jgi:hypothetical protein